LATALDILKQYWGYEAFRASQADIIDAVLKGKDTLALLPTGGGKSICFQIPALLQEGICIVVSPLIALMKDQVAQLQKRHIEAVAIYSGMHYKEIDRLLDNCIYGNTKFLYLSPERLLTDLVRARIAKMKVNLWAVDEAHCISQWGYDFRPPYLQIAEIRELHPKVPVLALTATATATVERDIQEKLVFQQPNVFRKSFLRPNLAYVVLQEEHKEPKMLDIFKKVPGSGIVYVRNRRKTKELALLLQKRGIRADFYHAGLDAKTRSQKQDDWISGKIRVMVSTNAFGMGIDKPNVRSVVHMDLPDSLEAYFQEAGRGGRDGKKSYAVLLYNEVDKVRLEKNLEQSFPPMKTIRRVYRALGSYYQLAVGGGENKSYDLDIVQFAKTYQLDLMQTFNSLRVLEQEGWLTLSEGIFVPSQLMIKVSKEDLYAYQIKNAQLDKILKVILRSTQGAFGNYVKIKERQLAKVLRIELLQLRKALEKMQTDGIINYLPQKDQPQLTFLLERVDADNLTIDQAAYQFRQKQQHRRIRYAIDYAEHVQCRSQQLLAYFDEKDAPRCGVCDVCLGRNNVQVTEDEVVVYQTKIQQILGEDTLSIHELVDSFTPKRREKMLEVVDILLAKGKLRRDDDQIRWQP
jgi:ATP-dependent DNA helicase RecQ